MSDEGKYMQVWKKYVPVIRLLLKKSANGEQKLKLYRHEFETSGVKAKTGYSFNLEINNGKAANKIGASAIAKDLMQAMTENPDINEFLKTRKVKLSMGKAFDLLINQIPPEEAVSGEPSANGETPPSEEAKSE